MTVIDSKEDKKLSERNGQNVVKFTTARVGLDENLESLGLFEKKTSKRQEDNRDHKHDNRQGKK